MEKRDEKLSSLTLEQMEKVSGGGDPCNPDESFPGGTIRSVLPDRQRLLITEQALLYIC